MTAAIQQNSPSNSPASLLVRWLLVFGLLYGFLVAIQLMGGSIKALGKDSAETLFDGVSNPFAGLSVGILATVLLQSSSTTTSMIVSMVGAAKDVALPLASAIPMILGANIGTTITNTIVSVGHIRQGPEFRRAFAAATVHDFFNLLCVAVMLPLELTTGFLQKSAVAMTGWFVTDSSAGTFKSPVKAAVKQAFKLIQDGLEGVGLEGIPLSAVMLTLGVVLTFACLILITKNMKVLISGRMEQALNSALGKSGVAGIIVGAAFTFAVQSSSITTSLLVPMCAAGVLSLRNAFPIMLGANIGTTLTGVLASQASETSAGLTIALVHVTFNILGVIVFFSVPAFRNIPIALAELLASKAQKSPVWVIAYVGTVFIGLPLAGYLLF
ncbi:MAG: sodium-dependent phosphate cotransporter [Planctomycetota bacterium]|jgi:sodium-dependent phosphate cotransporter